MAGLIGLAGGATTPARSLARPAVIKNAPTRPPPRGSLPEVRIGEATLGRESLEAIAREAAGERPSMPVITVGQATLGRESLEAIAREAAGGRPSMPVITVGQASLGRESLAAIERDALASARHGSSPEILRVELSSIDRESLLDIAREEARQAAGPRPSHPIITPDRITQPWVDPVEDAKRSAGAASLLGALDDDDVIDLLDDVLELPLEDEPGATER